MDRDPVETSELVAFVRTVSAGSLSRAADELGLPRATVSRRLARLEKRLGVRLLRRTTRSLVLTDAGEALLRHARIVLDAVGHAEASVRHESDTVRGDLRVSVPPAMSDRFFAFVTDFAKRFPEVRLHVFFSTASVDLRRDGWDVALRASTNLEPGLVARTLARLKIVAVASPEYLARHGNPRSGRDLRRHRCLVGHGRDGLPQTQWSTRNGALRVEGAFVSNDPFLLADAARRGLGIAMLPTMVVEHLTKAGELVQVLPGVLEAEARVAVVYAERELVPPHVRAFVDALIAWGPAEFGRNAGDVRASVDTRASPRKPREPQTSARTRRRS